MKVLGNVVDGGIVAGNVYNKYETKNPIARGLLNGFRRDLLELAAKAGPSTIHEVGCGEGFWTLCLRRLGYAATGSDFSGIAIAQAKNNAGESEKDIFFASDILSLGPEHGASLILACEVLEHLSDPAAALKNLAALAKPWFLCSVPNEPVWSILNICRGKYWSRLGNTPGHLQRWSKNAFLRLLGENFTIIEVRTPFPWTMALCRAARDQ